MTNHFLTVWLQGGPANDWRYETLIEPEPEILMFPDPFHDGVWIRVVGPWEGATLYRRVPDVEQFDHERIYYPANA